MKHGHATRLVLLALLATPLAAGGNVEGVNQVLEERWKSTSPLTDERWPSLRSPIRTRRCPPRPAE